MKRTRFIAIIALILSCLAAPASAGQVSGIQRQAFLQGLSLPVYITNAGDWSNRLFVVQQRGLIKVVEPGQTTTNDFIDLSSKVSQSGSERGLLGLAFHPDFRNNGFFFVNYTRQSDGATVIERYKAINANTVGDITTAFPIITIPQDFTNHNGGQIAFGPDGHLYIGMGDGGSANDPNNRAQNINSLLGKMLRLTPSVSENQGAAPYTVPADNPYVGVNGADEIYALGLRNPYRWSFDRGGQRQLWAGDVGQFAIEEVDIITRGGNYGWRVYEGTSCTNNDPALCNSSNYVAPVFQYSHTGGRCSVTGGYVYRGDRGTFPQGAYVYGDFCTGEFWFWDGANQVLVENTPRNISAFGEDENGELYVVGYGGTVEKLVNSEPFPARAQADFDGDRRTDLGVFRPANGNWYVYNSSTGGFRIAQFGADGDIPVPEDYDRDGLTDLAVYRPGTAEWFVFRSSDGTVEITSFGISGDIPVPGDFLGDDRVELAVYRPSEGVWYVVNTPNGSNAGGFTSRQFGISTDTPVVGDYDGDGKSDLAVYRASTGVWYYKSFDDADLNAVQWGLSTDVPAPGDFDGDGRTDINIYRPSEGNWYTFLSETGALRVIKWGIAEDIPNPGDYDGDGRADTAIWRPTTGEWFVLRSSDFSYFAGPLGSAGDLPLPRYDAP